MYYKGIAVFDRKNPKTGAIEKKTERIEVGWENDVVKFEEGFIDRFITNEKKNIFGYPNYSFKGPFETFEEAGKA